MTIDEYRANMFLGSRPAIDLEVFTYKRTPVSSATLKSQCIHIHVLQIKSCTAKWQEGEMQPMLLFLHSDKITELYDLYAR